jgi:nucleoside-diphosphate-sugar epimerase
LTFHQEPIIDNEENCMPDISYLVTGASGEIGQALIEELSGNDKLNIVSMDLKPLPERLAGKSHHIQGDILDNHLLRELVEEHQFERIFHMAALLSTTGEYKPHLAHQVNACGTFDLLTLASELSLKKGRRVRFLFPSSIAAYGLPDLDTKQTFYHIKEREWNEPATMYGCTKLYCEKIGKYYTENYYQLEETIPTRLDFRALRYPGLISAVTIPTGGTTDYGPEMLHAAARGEPYECFVGMDVRVPFMAMPDAVRAMLMLADAPPEALKKRVYNITSFSLSAADFHKIVLQHFPGAQITFKPDWKRQAIVDSWPADLDDSAAREDWGWEPEYNLERAFKEYLIPNIMNHYR